MAFTAKSTDVNTTLNVAIKGRILERKPLKGLVRRILMRIIKKQPKEFLIMNGQEVKRNLQR